MDAGEARAHLRALSRAGIGHRRAAELAGLPSSVVSKMLFGGPADRPPTRRIRPETAAKILAVQASPENLGAHAPVPAAGTRRRLQALVAIGWSQAELGRRLGMNPSNFGTMLGRDQVTAATDRAVRQLYDGLWNRKPPEPDHRARISASRARSYARSRGWAPPMAWDDEEIDKPDAAQPQGWERTGRQTRRAAEVAEDAAELFRQGYSREHVQVRLGMTKTALERSLLRARAERREPELVAEAG